MTSTQILLTIVAIVCALFGILFAIAALIEHRRARKATSLDESRTHRSSRNLIAIFAAIAILQALADIATVAR